MSQQQGPQNWQPSVPQGAPHGPQSHQAQGHQAQGHQAQGHGAPGQQQWPAHGAQQQWSTPQQPAQQSSGAGTRALGWVLLVWSGLVLLGRLARLGTGRGFFTDSDDPARMVGAIIGFVIFVIGPAVLGWRLVSKPKA